MRRLTSILVLLTAVMTVQAEDTPLIGNVLNRQTTSLNGDWHYLVDVQECGYYGYRREKLSYGFFRNAKPQQPDARSTISPRQAIAHCSTSEPSTTKPSSSSTGRRQAGMSAASPLSTTT